MIDKRITCTGDPRDPYYKECANCYYCDSYKGKHYSEDWVKCRCPISIEKGDRIRILIYKMRKYTKRK